jgi:hypothetical protein
LYFISKAFEDDKDTPLLGMQKYSKGMRKKSVHKIFYSGLSKHKDITDTHKHGGFDDDAVTMNHVLQTVLGPGVAPEKFFTEEQLKEGN